MNGKKTLPLLVIATLMLSMIPSIMFAHATLGVPTLSAGHGKKGDTIKVFSADTDSVPAGTTVNLYWDDSTIAWNGVKGLLNSTTAAADGSYEIWFDVPEAVYNVHHLWVKTTTGGIADVATVPFTVDTYLKLSPSTGLVGDTITLNMYGFPKSADIAIDFGTHIDVADATANSLGTASTSYKIPTGSVSSTINAYNGTVTSASAAFTVGPVITVSPTAATVGSLISIVGRGFYGSGSDTLEVSLLFTDGDEVDHVYTCYITTANPVTLDSTGRLRATFVVPSVLETSDAYSVQVAIGEYLATADFEVTAKSKVSVNPEWGPQASSITISGANFPKIKDVVVDVTLGDVLVGTVKTLADGTFSKAFRVPAIADGVFDLRAETDLAYMVNATTNFKVGTMNIILSDDSATTGATIGITANGFTDNGHWNATIGSKTLVDDGLVSLSGLIDSDFMVPQMAPGVYTITVWDVDAEIKLTTTFTITSTTTVTFSVPSAPNGFNVTIKGSGFADEAGNPLDFMLYNKTSTGAADFWTPIEVIDLPGGKADMDPVVSNSTGEFYGYWIVGLTDVDLSKGAYYLNVTDAQDYAVTVPFTVGDVHIVATPRKASFKVGETISFTLEYSFPDDVDQSILKIYDPSGALVFSGNELGIWTKTGLWYTAPYSSQTAGGNPMVIADDAPLGTWTWKWIDNAGDTAASGSFAVVASDASATDAKITALATQITALQTAVSTAVAGAQTAATQAGTKADAATAAATAAGAKADAATAAATAAGTKADAATAAATAAAASAKSAADAASGLTTLVYAAIGASLIAALAAIVALMQISRKIA